MAKLNYFQELRKTRLDTLKEHIKKNKKTTQDQALGLLMGSYGLSKSTAKEYIDALVLGGNVEKKVTTEVSKADPYSLEIFLIWKK